MRKILISLGVIAFVGAVVAGATGAFFSDSETSTGNTLAAGAIDLGIDNHSYYNNIENAGTTWRIDYDIDPVLGDNPDTTEVETDFVLESGRLFFNFDDLKPGDSGEDTISLHVLNNDAYLCADVTLTSDDDNGLTEPEGDDGDTTGGVGEGELADQVNFFWWADDGDNVYETCEGVTSVPNCVSETLLPAGPLGNLSVGQTATVDLADANSNIWTPNAPGPLPAEQVAYIGKAWCFGSTAFAPYPQDGLGGTPNNGPDAGRPVVCDGAPVNNVAQTDSLTATISFRAVQSRHNGSFECEAPSEG